MAKKIVSRITFAEHLGIILSSWRVLLIAFLAGGLLGLAIYALAPSPYRAMAVIVIDQNLEAAYPTSPDREFFYYLQRETTKLKELAWSDTVLGAAAEKLGDISIENLRDEKLQLSQPYEGGWKMYAVDSDPIRAKLMANAWADAFEDAVRKGTAIELQLDAAKLNLDQMLNADVPADPDKVEMLNNQIAELSAQSYGINPRIQVFRSQKKEISANRMTSQGAYVLGGALIALILTILYQVVVKMGNKTR